MKKGWMNWRLWMGMGTVFAASLWPAGGGGGPVSAAEDPIPICDFPDQKINPNNMEDPYFTGTLTIDDNYIYFDANQFYDEGDNKFIYRITRDGTGLTQVSDWCYDSLTPYKDYLLCLETSHYGVDLKELRITDHETGCSYYTMTLDTKEDASFGSYILNRVGDILIYGMSGDDVYTVYARNLLTDEEHIILQKAEPEDGELSGAAIEGSDGYLYLMVSGENRLPEGTGVWRISTEDLNRNVEAEMVVESCYCWLPRFVFYTMEGVYRLHLEFTEDEIIMDGKVDFLAFADIDPVSKTWEPRETYGSDGWSYSMYDFFQMIVAPFGDNLLMICGDETGTPETIRFYFCPDMDISRRTQLFPFVPETSSYSAMSSAQYGFYDNTFYMVVPGKENRTYFLITVFEDGTYRYTKMTGSDGQGAPVSSGQTGTGTGGTDVPQGQTAGAGTTVIPVVPSQGNAVQSEPGTNAAPAQSQQDTNAAPSEVSGDYVIAYSDRVYLAEEDVKDLSLRQINYAKNEIYARHGRKFKSPELQSYFNSKSWYKGTIEPEDFTEAYMQQVMNQYEYVNAAFLSKVEFERDPNGYPLDK